MLSVGLRKISTCATTKDSQIVQIRYFVTSSIKVGLMMLFLFAAEDGKDHYVEESEATTCETRADESFLLQKPVTSAKLEARTDSLQVPHSH